MHIRCKQHKNSTTRQKTIRTTTEVYNTDGLCCHDQVGNLLQGECCGIVEESGTPGPEVIKLFSCSAQLRLKF